MEQYRVCLSAQASGTTVSWQHFGQRGGGKCRIYSRKNEEFIADFDLLIKRNIRGLDQRIFDLYFRHALDYMECSRALAMTPGKLFHAVYRIEATVGQLCRELRPYPIFPLSEYFS